MDLLDIIILALALSMDALAVSVANGFIIKELKIKHALRIAIAFGLFQAVMPVLGWAAGVTFSSFLTAIDHWIAFILLGGIGGKMIYESRKIEEEEEAVSNNALHLPTLFFLAVATSIDALAVGLSFAFLDVAIISPVLIIGGITAVLCFVGVFIGNKVGHLFESKLEFIGGIILIGIGIKILIEHLFFL